MKRTSNAFTVFLTLILIMAISLTACNNSGSLTQKLANEVKESIQQKMDSEEPFKDYSITIDKVTLVRSGDYTFVGTAVMKTSKASHEVMLGVVADSQNLVWAIEPKAFAFLATTPKSTLRAAIRAEKILQDLQSGKPPVPNERTDFKYDLNAAKDGVDILKYVGTRQDVVIPAEIDGFPVVNIAENAFEKNEKITSVVLQPPLRSISNSAFQGCKNLVIVTLPDTLKFIGDSAFMYCTTLVSANIPNSVMYVGRNAYSYCESLSSVVLPNNIEAIERQAFRGCVLLQSIAIPENVGFIFYNAFKDCANLLSVDMPSNKIVYIGGNAKIEDDGYKAIINSNGLLERYAAQKHQDTDYFYGGYKTKLVKISLGDLSDTVKIEVGDREYDEGYHSNTILGKSTFEKFDEGVRYRFIRYTLYKYSIRPEPKNGAFEGCFRLDLQMRQKIEQSGYEGGFN